MQYEQSIPKFEKMRKMVSRFKKPALILTAEELFELWRSLDIRIYIDESTEAIPKKTIRTIKQLRDSLADALKIPPKLRNDFRETYHQNIISDYDHGVIHELVDGLGYEEDELESMSGRELVDELCRRYKT